jgi:Ser/Thr protein kinase RdoA (MazF antagonist)
VHRGPPRHGCDRVLTVHEIDSETSVLAAITWAAGMPIARCDRVPTRCFAAGGGGGGLEREVQGVEHPGVQHDEVDRQHRLDRVAWVAGGESVEAVLHDLLPGGVGDVGGRARQPED